MDTVQHEIGIRDVGAFGPGTRAMYQAHCDCGWHNAASSNLRITRISARAHEEYFRTLDAAPYLIQEEP